MLSIPKSTYAASTWYWNVVGISKVWSGASLSFVDRSGDFSTWPHSPTTIGNVVDLMQVMVQQVQPQIMMQGIVVEAPATLAGTYAITDDAHAAMTVLATSIASGRALPGGGSAFNYIDMTGMQHSFSAEQFLAFAHACDNYIYNWTQALAANLANKSAAYPSNTITLA